MAQMGGEPPTSSNAYRDIALEPKHKVFLCHNDAQRDFVESLIVDLERYDRYPFLLDKRSSLQMVSPLSLEAIDQCYVGVVILSDGFFTSKRPMMELVYMLDKLEKGKSFFHILPVFYSISAEQFVTNQSRWLSCWKEWARQDKRVNVEKCEAALKHIRSLNGLRNRGDDEVSFREAIVGEICRLVPAETSFGDSHFQGRSRICKVILEKIAGIQNKNNINGVCVVGLYGMGGIGKTSICKVLCHEFWAVFRGRVCHAELQRTSKDELLRKVLTTLTNINLQTVDERNADELQALLRTGITAPVFLAWTMCPTPIHHSMKQ